MAGTGVSSRLNEDVSWLTGIWTGDNFSSREGTVIRNGKPTSGRFGIVSNDAELIRHAMRVLRSELDQRKVRIDVQLPRNRRYSKSKLRLETARKFGISKDRILVYNGSEWRRNIGYAVYVNNTELLRSFSAVYRSLNAMLGSSRINAGAFLQGIADAEADVNKISRMVTLHTKDKYVLGLIKDALNMKGIDYTVAVDTKRRYRVYVKDIKGFNKLVGFRCKRKQKAVDEILGGNLMRQKDLEYLDTFMPMLKNGATSAQIRRKTGLPVSTIQIVLRNLHSGGALKRSKVGRENHGFCYFYRIPPSSCRTKLEMAGKKRQWLRTRRSA